MTEDLIWAFVFPFSLGSIGYWSPGVDFRDLGPHFP